jgi:hypothetical protein
MNTEQFKVGDWVMFTTTNEISLKGKITKTFHTITGEQGSFFSVVPIDLKMEMTFRTDRIKNIHKIDPPANEPNTNPKDQSG